MSNLLWFNSTVISGTPSPPAINMLLVDGSPKNSLIPNSVIGSGDFNFGIWINTTQTATSFIFQTGDATSNNTTGIRIILNDTASSGKIRAVAHSGASFADVETTGAFNDGNNHFIAFTREGTTFTLYIDGVSIGTDTMSGAINNTSDDWRVGSAYNGSDVLYFDGSIANFSWLTGTGAGAAARNTDLYNSGEPRQFENYGSAVTDLYGVAIPYNNGVIDPENDRSINNKDATLNGSAGYTGAAITYAI